MPFAVDQFRKVTISLGGPCLVNCRHCYTTVDQFRRAPSVDPASVLDAIASSGEPFNTICISGDTDCFLDPVAGLELIAGAARRFPHADVMFTSRLVPEDRVVNALSGLASEMASRRQLLLPGISLVSMKVPNFSEMSRRIPAADSRLQLLRQFAAAGMACLLALRPTFPFRLVGRDDIRAMIGRAADSSSAVLGEIMILDEGGQLARRLQVPSSTSDDRSGQLTFLNQRSSWRKRTFSAETSFAAQVCVEHKVPYFLRSGMALAYIRKHWDWERGALIPAARIADAWSLDAPDP